MDDVFADTNYWIAKIFPQDQWHAHVIEVEYEIGIVNLITTETVLVETLNYFSEYRRNVKETAFLIVKSILESDEVTVIEQTNEVFLAGVEFYGKRLDKGYSLTDCISMNACRRHSIMQILTHDGHFEQEGFSILF